MCFILARVTMCSNSNYIYISDYMHTLPKNMIPEVIVNFKEIIPISAHSGEGIEELIMCLRKVLDEESEKKIEDHQNQQLRALRSSEI